MNSVIIVAGGIGSRMKRETPKQFELLKHKPVIVYSIEKFLAFDKNIQLIIVLDPKYHDPFSSIQKKFHVPSVTLADGGETRFHSVKNGLEKVDQRSIIVAVHDAARPLVSLQTIQNTFAEAERSGAAVPVIEMNESLREIDGQNDAAANSKAVDRKNYRVVQTPQCFKKEILWEAYKQPYVAAFTDDASVVETAGNKIYLTQGNAENIKITYAQDLTFASQLL